MKVDDFELDSMLGAGTSGDVYAGRHGPSGTEVAVKILSESSHEERRRFRREIQAQARLTHPGIVRLYDYGAVDDSEADVESDLRAGQLYVVMERADRGSLRSHLPVETWREIRAVVRDTLRALAFAHSRGLVHRDLKPENLLLFEASCGERPRIKLADFGLAHRVGRRPGASSDELESFAGTPAYSPPEQLRSNWRDYGPWTDLYSVGGIVWELVCGAPPFGFDTNRASLGHLEYERPALEPKCPVPEGLEAWLHRAMAITPRDRFHCAADALEALPGEGRTGSPGDAVRGPENREREREASGDEGHVAGTGLGLIGLRELPFVDRDGPVDDIRDALGDAAAEESPRLVVVVGETGVGKSRLIEWSARRAEEVGVARLLRTVHSSGGMRRDEGLSGLVLRLVRGWGLDRADLFDRIADWLADWTPGPSFRGDDARALTELVCPTGRKEANAGPNFRFPNARARYVVLARLLSHAAAERPVVVWMDDLELGRDSIGFLEWVFDYDELAESIVFAATASREAWSVDSDVRDRLRGLANRPEGRVVELDPLDRDDQRELIRRFLPVSAELEELLAIRTEGNPLFAAQMLTDWAECGRLEAGEQGYEWAGGAMEPPADLRELWEERIERFVGQTATEGRGRVRAALEIGATLGREVDRDEWRAACREASRAPADGFEESLIRHGLADRTREGWRFAHGLLVETLEHSAERGGRHRDWHRACARMLQARFSERAREAPERLAHHWVEAGELERALEPLMDAASKQWRRGEFRRWGDLLEYRRELLDTLEIPAGDPRRLDNALERARFEYYSGDLDEAERRASQVVRAVRSGGEEAADLASAADEIVGYVRLREDDFAAAERRAERSVDWAEDSDDPARLGAALAFRGRLEQLQLRLEEAVDDYERASRHFARADHRWGELNARTRRASALATLGEWNEAAADYQKLREEADEAGYRRLLATVFNGLGAVAIYRGDLARGREYYEQYGVICGNLGDREGVAIGENHVAEAFFLSESFERAEMHWTNCRQTFRELGRDDLGALVEIVGVGIAAGRGDWGAFDRRFERFEGGWPAEERAHRDEPLVLEKAGDLAAEAERPRRAVACWRIARELMEAIGDRRTADLLDEKICELEG